MFIVINGVVPSLWTVGMLRKFMTRELMHLFQIDFARKGIAQW